MSLHNSPVLSSVQSVARVEALTLHYGPILALDSVSLDIPSACMVGVIGPDGVGKSSLLSLLSGSRKIQTGKVELFGYDMSDRRNRERVCHRVAYMPQGLGRHLYSTLTVFENIDFFGSLFGLQKSERRAWIDELLHATGLSAFKDRFAGKLSGGMKQKLGICCALIHEPDILILDEPTTGIDPLSRRLFWELIDHIREVNPNISIVVATAYMEEAARFDWLVAMHDGQVLFKGKVEEFLQRKGSSTVEEAFIAIQLSPDQLKNLSLDIKEQLQKNKPSDFIATETFIEAHHLTKRFGDFTAVDHVSFQIARGEIFGFLGSNGCGKTTTMKMLTGLLSPSEGEAKLFGHVIDSHDLETRRRVGYMSQSFSLYTELSVKQNLILHARLFNIPEEQISEKINKIIHRFGLDDEVNQLPEAISLGQRQRLSLAVAMIHSPEILILDEPTSGVDPIARDIFWQFLIELSRQDKVTIFISTHFMNEAERCDRISFMHAGRVLATASPAALIEQCKAKTLEEAFIKFLGSATGPNQESKIEPIQMPQNSERSASKIGLKFSLQRVGSYIQREALDIYRDATRFTLSIIGSIILMLAFGYGIAIDVENLSFAVLDRDQTDISRDYIYSLSGSRYFVERPPIKDYEELDHRMRNGEISLGLEIPSGFARDILHGKSVSIGTWIDGSMPRRAEIVRSYVQGINHHWLTGEAKKWLGMHSIQEPVSIDTQYLYNPDIKSVKVMVPAIFAIVLMMIPAILTALSIVREKEFGTIVNFYVSPVTRLEFLIGKQISYIILATISFFLMMGVALFIFHVPVKGNFLALLVGTILFVITSTSIGLLVSTFTKSQTSAIFATTVLTILPTIHYSGLLDPISSLEGIGSFIGHTFPTTFYLNITRGVFSKGLGFHDLAMSFVPLIIVIPLLVGLSTTLLRKQEH